MDIMNFEEKKDLEVNKLEIKENLFDMQKLKNKKIFIK